MGSQEMGEERKVREGRKEKGMKNTEGEGNRERGEEKGEGNEKLQGVFTGDWKERMKVIFSEL